MSCCQQDLGEEPYKANVMKITGNFFIVACVETIAEAMTLAEKNGIPRQAHAAGLTYSSCLLMQRGCCRDTIAHFVSSTFPGPIYPGYAERLAAGDFEISPSSPGFPVTGESVTSDTESMCGEQSCWAFNVCRTYTRM